MIKYDQEFKKETRCAIICLLVTNNRQIEKGQPNKILFKSSPTHIL
jgi:hypothetical protein